MKKILIAISIFLIVSNSESVAQTVDLPKDSITTLLCKKWTTDYAILQGVKVGKTPDAADINFEFRNDNTFTTTMSGVKEKHIGTWSYDSRNRLIQLVANGKKAWSIISLKPGELIMSANMKSGAPEDKVTIVYKVISN